MKFIVYFLGLLLWSDPVYAREWTDREKLIYGIYSGVVILDAAQSYSAMQDPCQCYREANPLFGDRISDGEAVAGALFSMGIMYWMIEEDSPEWLLWSVTAGRAAVVVNNHMVGARIDISF